MTCRWPSCPSAAAASASRRGIDKLGFPPHTYQRSVRRYSVTNILRVSLAVILAAIIDGPIWAQEPSAIQQLEKTGGPATRKTVATPVRVEEKTNAIEWITIVGGSFMMGSKKSSMGQDEELRHSVTVKIFQLAKTEVTAGQYKKCVSAGACEKPDRDSPGDDYPVVGVNWEQSKKFSEWVGGRLPTEAEWEYAARSGGKEQKYPWGNNDATCKRAVIAGCEGKAAPVCSKTEGNTKQGLCDMAGNVWEWTQDRHHRSYEGAPTDGSAWEDAISSARVVRGNSWRNEAWFARAAFRGTHLPDKSYDDVGFRPAR